MAKHKVKAFEMTAEHWTAKAPLPAWCDGLARATNWQGVSGDLENLKRESHWICGPGDWVVQSGESFIIVGPRAFHEFYEVEA